MRRPRIPGLDGFVKRCAPADRVDRNLCKLHAANGEFKSHATVRCYSIARKISSKGLTPPVQQFLQCLCRGIQVFGICHILLWLMWYLSYSYL